MDAERIEKVEIAAREDLWRWLEAHHDQEASVWLVTFKKVATAKYVSRDEILDALIAYGWIDGLRSKLDEARTMQLISPRRQQVWAKTYKDRAARLEARGEMRPAGRAAIEAARALGLWTASDPMDALDVPEDLAAALALKPTAERFFLGAAPSYRRNVLRWIASAKRPATRAKRIATTVEISSRSEKVPHF